MEILCNVISAHGYRYVIWFLVNCSDPMLKNQPQAGENPIEASAPSSDEMKKKDEPVDE